jgi:hypothetical protein
MYGWNVHDGNDFVDMDLTPATGETFTSDEYTTWWNRFRGQGFEAERTEYFDASDFSAYDSSSAEWMAAESATTTSMYSCGVHAFIINESDTSADVYTYIFDDRADPSTGFVNHGDELAYMLKETPEGSTIS